jgi:hypothetical protein
LHDLPELHDLPRDHAVDGSDDRRVAQLQFRRIEIGSRLQDGRGRRARLPPS